MKANLFWSSIEVVESESYCSFTVCGSVCAVPVTRVHEIVCDQPVTPVPLSHESVRGLINLRGQILSVLDLGQMMGDAPDGPMPDGSTPDGSTPDGPTPDGPTPDGPTPDGPTPRGRYHVIVEIKDEFISLLVDEMGPVVTLQTQQMESPPGNLEESVARLIESVARLPEDLLFILDLPRVVDVPATA